MADTFVNVTWVADELLTSTKLNQAMANQSNFHNGSAFGDGIIVTRHLAAASVTLPKLGDWWDWGKILDPLAYSAISGTWTPTDPNNGISGNPLLYTIRSNAQHDYIEFKTMLPAGTYSIGMRYDRDVNRGIAALTIDGVSVGSSIDMYNSSRIHATFANFTNSFVLANSGQVTLRVALSSKHASSSGYILGLYGIVIRRSL